MSKWVFVLYIVCSFYWVAPAQAQLESVTSSSKMPLFAGVHAFQGQYEVYFPSTPNASGTGGAWQLTAGLNVSTRVAVQLGYTYVRQVSNQDPSYTGTNAAGQFLDGSYYSNRWTNCVPLLVRYAAVRSRRPLLQVDVVLGLTLLTTRDVFGGEDRINNQIVTIYYDEDKATQLYATGGIGLRYPFGRHFEGILDWTYSRNFHAASESTHLQLTGNKLGLTRALSLGLRYRFAVKKKTVPATGL